MCRFLRLGLALLRRMLPLCKYCCVVDDVVSDVRLGEARVLWKYPFVVDYAFV